MITKNPFSPAILDAINKALKQRSTWDNYPGKSRETAAQFIAFHLFLALKIYEESAQISMLQQIFLPFKTVRKDIKSAIIGCSEFIGRDGEVRLYVFHKMKHINPDYAQKNVIDEDSAFEELRRNSEHLFINAFIEEESKNQPCKVILPLGENFAETETELQFYGNSDTERQAIATKVAHWTKTEFKRNSKAIKSEEVAYIISAIADRKNGESILDELKRHAKERRETASIRRLSKKYDLCLEDRERLATTPSSMKEIVRVASALLQPIIQGKPMVGIQKDYVCIVVPVNYMGMPGEYTVQFSHEAIVDELRVLAPEERTTTWIQNKTKQCEETIEKTVKTVAVNSTLLPVTADAVIASLPIWKDIPDKWDNSTVRSKMQQKLQRIMAQKTQAYNIKMTIQRFHARGNFVDQFRMARGLKRRLIARLGPTNSGKTYAALKDMAAAASGVYLAPLRLLALEKQEELIEMGIPTSLITGEERNIQPSNHFCKTVEMVETDKLYEVAIIDEVQMLLDQDRGWAWTNAICGVAAPTVYLTGPAYMAPLIENLAKACGDTLEIIYTTRSGALHLEPPSRWPDVEPGSAVVAFSRQTVLDIKCMLEHKGMKAAVLYGSLSPEVRREQARLFRQGDVDVLVATDAIGMGLNLPAKTVYFWECTKFDGEQVRNLKATEIQQIAGRAGRGLDGQGFVGSFSKIDFKLLEKNLTKPTQISPATKFAASPTPEHIKFLSEELRSNKLLELLYFFMGNLKVENSPFQPQISKDTLALASYTDKYPSLPPEIKYHWACAPAGNPESGKDGYLLSFYFQWLKEFSEQKPSFLKINTASLTSAEKNAGYDHLETLEDQHKVLSLYRWLYWRYPASFPDFDTAESLRKRITAAILKILARRAKHAPFKRKTCQSCGRVLNTRSIYDDCTSCYQSKRGHYDDDYEFRKYA